jgi:hypothetical protein
MAADGEGAQRYCRSPVAARAMVMVLLPGRSVMSATLRVFLVPAGVLAVVSPGGVSGRSRFLTALQPRRYHQCLI